MLPRLYDAAGLRAVASLTETEFSLYAASGLLPRSLGMFRGLPLFDESGITAFCKDVLRREPAAIPDDFSLASLAVSGLPSREIVTEKTPNGVAMPEVDAPSDEFVASEFNQIQAADYLGVSPAFLNTHTKAGNLKPSKKYGATVYSRDDLEAFKKTSAYTLRRRKGFSGGKPKTESVAERYAREAKEAEAKREKIALEGKAVLSRKAAADYLGMSEEELRIMERDKLGPAYSGLGYRVDDLERFKSQHIAERSRDVTMTAGEAASYLGLTGQTLQRWRTHGENGPKWHRVAGQGRQVYYMKSDLDAFASVAQKFLETTRNRIAAGRAHADQLAAARAAKSRKRVKTSQTQRANAPAKKATKAKSVGAKVKATKSSAGKVSPYNRHGGQGRKVANGARARA